MRGDDSFEEGLSVAPGASADPALSRNRGTIQRSLALKALLATIWAPLLAIAVGGFATWTAIRYVHQPLLEYESWRQTMTAITAYWMVHGGWRIAYETPILGYPWSIPLEVPFFQAIVATIASAGNFPLDPVGRLVSFAFLLACGWPAIQVARRLALPSNVAWVFCALLWSSPLYLFFGRAFLMETAALFFTFAALPYALDMREPGWRPALMFALLSTLGMLQKASTPLAMVVIMAVWLLVVHLRAHGFKFPPVQHLAQVIVAFLIPTVATVTWFSFTEAVKSHNPVMYATYSSEGMVDGWLGGYRLLADFGAQKRVLWDRVIVENAAGFIGMAALGTGLLGGSRRIRAVIALSLLLFVAPIWLIMNQHQFLPYYQVASVLFLLGALATAVVVGIPRLVGSFYVVPLVTVLLVGSNYYHYAQGYGRLVGTTADTSRSYTPTGPTTLAVTDVIRRYTPEDSAIAVFGLLATGGMSPEVGWSGEMAYYSQRKSITLGQFESGGPLSMVWEDPAAHLGGKTLGAMVFCFRDDVQDPEYNRLIGKYGTSHDPALFPIGDCHVWLPGVHVVEMAGGLKVQPKYSF